jgi:Ran GTPase-activating protein (RanGAP) involved in mRNA processing and transport
MKNKLRDEGLIELSKCLKYTYSLTHLDVSSNELTPKGIEALSKALTTNYSLASLNVSTVDGIQRNRMSYEGGKFIADYVIASEINVMQVLIFNNTCLGDKGLNSMLNQVCHEIRIS